MKTTDVFIAGGMPSVTYNPRTELGLENKLQDYLNTRHKLISITGPTKSGKTVLCRRNVNETQQILISGGEITTEDNFWELVLDQLNYSYVESSSAMTSSDDTISAGTSAQLSLWGVATFGGNGTTTRKNNNGTSHTKKYIINPKRSAIEKLKSLDKTLIIDDFHYIEQSIQQQIIRALKSPIFDGLNVIVLAVPHRAYDALKVETEMTGRVAQLEITSWEEYDLSEIASKGFKALNIISNDSIINTLAKESYGSPNLMQEFCLQLCKDNNVNETCKKAKTITLLTSSKAFFKSIAKSVASKVAYDRLARGPRQRSDRKSRVLKNGKTVDIYTATLLAIAHTGPKTEITIEELRASFKKIMDNPPQSQEIARVLIQMDKIAKQQQGEPVIDWSKEDNSLFIADPYFAFYLKWAIES